MRYATKRALIADIRGAHDALYACLAGIPASRLRTRGVWGDGWTVSDLIAHLAEWQFMFLRWYRDGLKGVMPAMPAPGYEWNETPRLNRAIWRKHRRRSPAAVRADFEAGYREILGIVEGLSGPHLLKPGHFVWTGPNALTTYIGANTASHYRFAVKVVERWLRRQEARPCLDTPKRSPS